MGLSPLRRSSVSVSLPEEGGGRTMPYKTLGLVVSLFVLEYQVGLIHGFLAAIEDADTVLGSYFRSAAFAVWVGGIVWGIRRRFELSDAKQALGVAATRAETAGLSDGLTGLPNRSALKAELSRRLAEQASGKRAPLVTVGLDIARFKSLNEIEGHATGDAVLVAVSDFLALAVGPADFVARTGADEFVVLTERTGEDEARLYAGRLQEAVARPLPGGLGGLEVRASAGIVVSPDGRTDTETLISRVEMAVQVSKAEGGRPTVFQEDMEVSIRERAEFERLLAQAIVDGEIEPWFQPVIDLATGRIRSFEILARWTHAERGNIPPSVFIPIAEETGKLGEMTLALLRRAAREARPWPADIKIALNISPNDFKNPWLAQEVLQILTEEGFSPRRLEIEITESALLVDHEQATKTVMSLKNQGISIALDDFGTGYASLHQLRMLPFDKIKIDQSFVRTMVDNPDSRQIVKAIIGLSGSLGLPTTAEGIETNGNARILKELGCTFGQGFLYSRAVPARDIQELLVEHWADGEEPSPEPPPSGPSGRPPRESSASEGPSVSTFEPSNAACESAAEAAAPETPARMAS